MKEVFYRYKLFILAKSYLVDLIVAKGIVSPREIRRSPKGECFLEYLLKLVEERSGNERYMKLLKKLIAMRFEIVEGLIGLVSSDMRRMEAEDPSGTYALLLRKKIEQAIDRANSTDVRFNKNSSFRARISRDIMRIASKLSKEIKDKAHIIPDSESTDADTVTEETIAHFTGYELVRPYTPEEMFLVKETIRERIGKSGGLF